MNLLTHDELYRAVEDAHARSSQCRHAIQKLQDLQHRHPQTRAEQHMLNGFSVRQEKLYRVTGEKHPLIAPKRMTEDHSPFQRPPTPCIPRTRRNTPPNPGVLPLATKVQANRRIHQAMSHVFHHQGTTTTTRGPKARARHRNTFRHYQHRHSRTVSRDKQAQPLHPFR